MFFIALSFIGVCCLSLATASVIYFRGFEFQGLKLYLCIQKIPTRVKGFHRDPLTLKNGESATPYN